MGAHHHSSPLGVIKVTRMSLERPKEALSAGGRFVKRSTGHMMHLSFSSQSIHTSEHGLFQLFPVEGSSKAWMGQILSIISSASFEPKQRCGDFGWTGCQEHCYTGELSRVAARNWFIVVPDTPAPLAALGIRNRNVCEPPDSE
jgi:hypothetical protein